MPEWLISIIGISYFVVLSGSLLLIAFLVRLRIQDNRTISMDDELIRLREQALAPLPRPTGSVEVLKSIKIAHPYSWMEYLVSSEFSQKVVVPHLQWSNLKGEAGQRLQTAIKHEFWE